MINKILRMSLVPIIFKFISMLAFIALVYIGLLATSNDASFLKILRNTNWANLLVWSYWWPLIIIFAVVFGRVWCFVCPVETITSLFAKIGLKKKVPAFLESGWGITIFYILILFFGIHGFAIHRDPTRMALYLIFLVMVSIAIGFIFEKNAFCAYFCPVGNLLGIYARLAPFGWRVKDQNVCKTCKDKSCIHKDNLYNITAKSCGVGLYPPKIEDNSQCILCSGCLKACATFNSSNQSSRPNPGLAYTGFKNITVHSWNISPAMAFFLLVVSGFIIYEITTEWNVTKSMLLFAPKYCKQLLSISSPVLFGFIKSVLLFMLLPLIIVLVPYLLSPLTKKQVSIKNFILLYIPTLVPIMAAAHIGKSLLKMGSRLPYFPVIGNDPAGIITAQGILNKSISLAYTGPSNVIILMILALLITGTALSLRLTNTINNKIFNDKKPVATFALPVVYGLIFITMLIAWKLI